MSVWYMQGVYGELNREASEALRQIDILYSGVGEDVFVVSVRDGVHGVGSLHYCGNAFEDHPLEVFNSDVFRRFRRLHVEGNKCTAMPCRECTVPYSEATRIKQ